MVADFEKRAPLAVVCRLYRISDLTAIDRESLMESLQVKIWSTQ